MFSKSTISLLLVLWVAVFSTSGIILAGTTGKIAGVITDKDSGEPLPGVNVMIVGTTMGAATDADGHFYIINVPVGTHNIKASMMGYTPMVVERLTVSLDLTTTIDFSLEPTVLEAAEEITVVAERPLIQLDQTSSAHFVSAEEIQNMPTRGYQELSALQAGVVRRRGGYAARHSGGGRYGSEIGPQENAYFIRGGRGTEVGVYVDGFSQIDPLWNQTSLQINNNAMEEVAVQTGGFNAEYGKNMSGIVNIITKSGGTRYSGSAEVETDFVSGSLPGTNSYGHNLYNLSFGGPIIPGFDKLTFYVSGELRDIADKSPAPESVINYSTAYAESLRIMNKSWWKDAVGDLDDGRLPHNSWDGWVGQGKLSFRPVPALRVDLNLVRSYDERLDYFEMYKYDIDHAQKRKDWNTTLSSKLTYTLNPSTYFEIGGTYFSTEHKEGDAIYFDGFKNITEAEYLANADADEYFKWTDDRTDKTYYYFNPYGGHNPHYDVYTLFYSPGGPSDAANGTASDAWDDYTHSKSQYWGIKGDLVSQVTIHHQIKTGFEYDKHTLRFMRNLIPVGGYVRHNYYGFDRGTGETDIDSDEESISGFDGPKRPYTFSAYIQDKIEYEGLIINAGLRFDYIDANTKAIKNWLDPIGTVSGVGDPNHVDETDLGDNRTSSKLSPRLGASFPVSDLMIFHLSYGKFFQQPDLNLFYLGTEWLEYLSLRGFGAAANPNLEFEETTAYEVGITRQISDNIRFDVTAYHKQTSGLTDVRLQESRPNGIMLMTNLDYGTIRGIDFSFEMRRINKVMAKIAYGLAYATSTGSAPTNNFNMVWQDYEDAKMTAPTDFDQRHNLSAIIDIRNAIGEGPTIGGMKLLEDAGVNFIFTAASGLPYTPDYIHNSQTISASPADYPRDRENSRYGPWTFRLDFKADRRISLGPIKTDLYLKILNVFNRVNPLRVYTATGAHDDDGYLGSPVGIVLANTFANPVQYRSLYREKLIDPASYDAARQVRFGAIIYF